MRLRHFLVLVFFALTLIPVAVFRAWPESAVFKTELEEVHERHLLLARNLAAALERYHRDVSNTFRLVVSVPEIWQASDRIAGTLSNLGLTHICIADGATGVVLHNIATENASCPRIVSGDFLQQFSSLSPSDIIFTEVTQAEDGRNVLQLLKRLEDGRIAFGDLRTDYFIELGQAISFGKRGHAAIVDHAGNVLYHPLPDWTEARRNIAALSSVQRMMNGETGVEVFFSPALNGDMIAGFTGVAPVGWGVMIPQPLAELQEKADFARNAAIFILIVGLFCTSVLAHIVSILSSRPVEQISAAARRIANGEPFDPSQIKTGRFLPKELRDLHNSFHDMVIRLRKSLTKIRKLAFTDTLTNLANRESFRRQLVTQINGNACGFLLFIDLDGFKAINDTHGHDAGDAVLKSVAQEIRNQLDLPGNSNDLHAGLVTQQQDAATPSAARLGGDEFAVFMPGSDAHEINALADRILHAISLPIAVGDKSIRVGASIGIAQHPQHGTTYSDLLKAADLAMYEAKRSGKNQVQHYTRDFKEAHEAFSRMGPELAEGFAQGQFDVHFQPVYDAQNFEIINVEALLRWQHPTLGLLEADSFLEPAAQFGFQRKIDMFIFEQTLAVVNDMAMRGAHFPGISLNFWVESISRPDFVEHIIRNKSKFPCPLSLELIHPKVNPSQAALWGLDQLHDAGISIELDDFGADAGSIAGLVELRPTSIKIDQKLVAHVDRDDRRTKLLISIIEMAHAQGIKAGAKGIETLEQVELLRDLGCDTVQGRALNGVLTHEDLFTCLTGARVRTLSQLK